MMIVRRLAVSLLPGRGLLAQLLLVQLLQGVGCRRRSPSAVRLLLMMRLLLLLLQLQLQLSHLQPLQHLNLIQSVRLSGWVRRWLSQRARHMSTRRSPETRRHPLLRTRSQLVDEVGREGRHPGRWHRRNAPPHRHLLMETGRWPADMERLLPVMRMVMQVVAVGGRLRGVTWDGPARGMVKRADSRRGRPTAHWQVVRGRSIRVGR